MPSDRKYRIYFGKPIIGDPEKEAVLDALSRRQLTNGGLVMNFEESFQDFTGGLAVAVSSCTAALHISTMILFKPGDEVIIPANGHLSAANAVELVGAKPVFCDVSLENGAFQDIESCLTHKTKGVIAVHYMGVPANLGELRSFCRTNGLYLIEDCALALGTHYENRHVGLWGDIGCFSFYPCKHITTGEGGMLLTSNMEIAQKAKALRSFGQTERHGDMITPGLNYRMTEIQAALGIEQMKRLPLFLKIRFENMLKIAKGLGDFKRIDGSYGTTVFLDCDRTEFRRQMQNQFIETSVYYPKPIPLMTHYRAYGHREGDFPNAEAISNTSVCLPSGPHMRPKHIDYMLETFRTCESRLSVVPALSAII